MFFSVRLHRFGSLAPYCIWAEFTGFFFHLRWFSHPVLLIQVENGPKEKNQQKKSPTKGITVVHVRAPPLFVRVREDQLLFDCKFLIRFVIF